MTTGNSITEKLHQCLQELDLKEKYLILNSKNILTKVVPEFTGDWDKDKELFKRIWQS